MSIADVGNFRRIYMKVFISRHRIWSEKTLVQSALETASTNIFRYRNVLHATMFSHILSDLTVLFVLFVGFVYFCCLVLLFACFGQSKAELEGADIRLLLLGDSITEVLFMFCL